RRWHRAVAQSGFPQIHQRSDRDVESALRNSRIPYRFFHDAVEIGRNSGPPEMRRPIENTELTMGLVIAEQLIETDDFVEGFVNRSRGPRERGIVGYDLEHCSHRILFLVHETNI